MSDSDSVSAAIGRPHTPGLWEWLRMLLRQLLGAGHPEAAIALPSDDAVAERGEEFVIAPCGYRIRVPQPSDLGHSVGQMLPVVREALNLVPPLPHVVMGLLRETQDARSTAASVAGIAASDPALAGCLLRTVNSAAFGLPRKVTSVAEAVSYMGFAMVRSIVMRLHLDQTLAPRSEQAGIDAEDIWIHSMAVANVADCLAERMADVDRGFVSTLGLLHDVGRLAINTELHEEMERVRAAARAGGGGLLSREAECFGMDHAGLGAYVGNRWDLPADLIMGIRWHHDPSRAFEANDPLPLRKAVHLVQVANQIAVLGYAYADEVEMDPIAPETWELLRLPASLAQLMDAGVRSAIARAVLLATDSQTIKPTVVRRFLRLRHGEEAARVAVPAVAEETQRRVEVDADWAASLFEPGVPLVELDEHAEGRAASGQAGAPAGRIASPNTQSGVERLIAAMESQQEQLAPPERATGAARLVGRGLLANLIGADDRVERVEVAQHAEGGRLVLAVRCESLTWARRLGPGASTEAGMRLATVELANVLNLDLFARVAVSSDGGTWVFVGR